MAAVQLQWSALYDSFNIHSHLDSSTIPEPLSIYSDSFNYTADIQTR